MKTPPHSAKSRSRSRLRLPQGSIIDRARNEACRQDFVSFIELVFNLLAPGRPFLMNWHIRALAYHLEQVRLGRIKRLIINLPPRFLKSIISSIAFPAFVLGHDPSKRVIVISYGLELATKFASDSRIVMGSSPYKGIFPGTRLSQSNETEIKTTRGGHRLATSIDGSLTGRGGDIIIIDDPHKVSDVESDIKREHVYDTYRNSIVTRFDDNENGAIILVGQRSHDDDLFGAILQHPNGWTVLKFPMIAEEDEQIQIGENVYHLRRKGDLLHPQLFSPCALDERRSQLDEATFAAQYQQCPSQPMGVMIKRDSIRYYDDLPTLPTPDLIQSWDTAIGVGGHNDYSVGVTVLRDERNNYYLVDVVRDRLTYPELKNLAIAQAKKYPPRMILIEAAGLGKTLVDHLRALRLPARAVIPEGDKLTRVSIQLEKFAQGRVFFPRQAPWLAALENELFAFPNGRYDDQIDALVQALGHPPFLSTARLRGEITSHYWRRPSWGFYGF